ncbi:hypothetical protein [Leptospira sp. GIMC2001]|uniref:hypothetical protein n=1 Tax=Leptospira sp. GIMC2001 TaxID=1513297 RepID=UPI002349B05D|nr:hypothetical protein [Leptospira sp. GIMC2001]WCL50148.1 hypothetical protein O4O04_04840 [Leptospira sp. GIMC2001]
MCIIFRNNSIDSYIKFGYWFHKFITFSLFILFLVGFSLKAETEIILTSDLPSIDNPAYIEQINCEDTNCISLFLKHENSDEVWDKVYDLLGQNVGKVLVEVEESPSKIDSLENNLLREYLREIAKRSGKIAFEPYYINTRGEILPSPSTFLDIFTISFNIYQKLKSYFLYDRMKNYNAKILYHPLNHNILVYFFVHKSFGDICNTIYSRCDTLEYLDDDSFDYQLVEVLKNAKDKNQKVTVNFNKTTAFLPQAKIDIDSLVALNQSSRVYKWLVASKRVERQNVKKERFMTLQIAITIIDYSLKAYDYIQQYKMYSVASDWSARATYEETDKGSVLKSIVFELNQDKN